MDVLSLVYSLNGLIIGAAFLPQIMALIRDTSGAISISICSWCIFTTVSTISLLYGVEKLHDPLYNFCSSISLLGNALILGLSILRRLQHSREQPLATVIAYT